MCRRSDDRMNSLVSILKAAQTDTEGGGGGKAADISLAKHLYQQQVREMMQKQQERKRRREELQAQLEASTDYSTALLSSSSSSSTSSVTLEDGHGQGCFAEGVERGEQGGDGQGQGEGEKEECVSFSLQRHPLESCLCVFPWAAVKGAGEASMLQVKTYLLHLTHSNSSSSSSSNYSNSGSGGVKHSGASLVVDVAPVDVSLYVSITTSHSSSFSSSSESHVNSMNQLFRINDNNISLAQLSDWCAQRKSLVNLVYIVEPHF